MNYINLIKYIVPKKCMSNAIYSPALRMLINFVPLPKILINIFCWGFYGVVYISVYVECKYNL